MAAVIRLRLTSSHTQVLTDAHVWSEVARASQNAGGCDFFNFVKRLSTMPDVLQKGKTVEKLRLVLKQLGIQWNCKQVDNSFAMAINSALPIVRDEGCMRSLGPLRELLPKMINEPTKIMRLAQVCKSICGETAMCEHLANIFQSLFTALMRKDVLWTEVTTSWLVGQSAGSAGFVVLCQVKKTNSGFHVQGGTLGS